MQFLDYVKNTGRKETNSTVNPFVRHLQNTIDTINFPVTFLLSVT